MINICYGQQRGRNHQKIIWFLVPYYMNLLTSLGQMAVGESHAQAVLALQLRTLPDGAV